MYLLTKITKDLIRFNKSLILNYYEFYGYLARSFGQHFFIILFKNITKQKTFIHQQDSHLVISLIHGKNVSFCMNYLF